MSAWPSTALIGYAVSIASISKFSERYWASANGSKSVPSSSMPIEKSLQCGTTVEYRSACVPRALRERYELRRRPIAIDQYVRRYPRADDLREKWVGRNVQRIGEEPLDMPAAVAAGWQADVVDDDQLDRTARRPCIEVRRVDTANFIQPAVGADDHLMPSRCIRYRSCRNVMPRS